MTFETKPFHRPEWSPLPREGCRNVEGRVLVHDPEQGLSLSLLHFDKDGTIDEHPGESDAEVFCLEGSGFVSLGSGQSELWEGQWVFWPRGVNHRLWTEDSEMTTLMLHRRRIGRPSGENGC